MKGRIMKISMVLVSICFCAALLFNACSSPQDNAYEAQEKVHKERLELVKQYQECLKKAEEEKTDAGVCEQYLKASEALK